MNSLFDYDANPPITGKPLPRWYRRSRPAGFALAVGLMALLISTLTFTPVMAQLQQSGGGGNNASVGSTGATAPTSATLTGGAFNTTLPTLTNGQMGAVQLDSSGRVLVGSIAGALPTGSNTIGAISNTGFSVTGALPAGSNAIGTVRTAPLTSCGTTAYDSGITTVPTTEAAATATATCVQAIYVNNLTSSAQTFSIKDNQGTPVVYVNGFSLPANSNMLLLFGGVKFASGVRWVATNASSVNAQIYGTQ